MTETKALKIAGIAGKIFGTLLVGAAVLAIKTWLLVLVLGWFGVTVLTLWKAVVVIFLLDLLFATTKNKK
jgi:hypothetical protein